ncbi:MAG TPA: phospho-N-acetylmuramoyl-pentapeptide-transferase [Chloroflexia bacterium]|nr:phospho-N-acetylmuramoyl-pentapeptide-transferase [Chloroflexia bacterium]
MWLILHQTMVQEEQKLLDTIGGLVGQTNPVPEEARYTLVIIVGLLMAGLSFLLTWAIGKPLLAWLRLKKMGKLVREDGPQTHLKKTGTPTMGGLMMIISILMVAVCFILVPLLSGAPLVSIAGGRGLSILLPIAIVMSCGLLGALDDMLTLVGSRAAVTVPVEPPVGETRKERKKRQKLTEYGLKGRFKMAWLLLISLIAAVILYYPLELRKVYIPFVREPIELSMWIYVPIAMLVIAGSANAVNLTDGMDALAASTAAVAFGAYGIIGFIQVQPQVVLLAFTVSGACFGFLWYNAFPAQVFMGDTGSLTLGALLAVLAFQTNQWLLLPIVGGVFVAEALSVMLQVGYFKYTKRRYGEGRRLLKMSPLHNHFELSGWSETQTSMRFWLISMVLALIGVALALL